MSKPLQNSIRTLNLEEVTPSNISNFCRKITAITEENLADLPYESIQSLLDASSKVITFFKSTEVFEAYKNKKELRSLSEEISSYIYQLNYYYPIQSTSDLSLEGFNYHELEGIVRDNQSEVENRLNEFNCRRNMIRSRSEFWYNKIRRLMGRPEFRLALDEYSEGIPAFFPHENKAIALHKEIMDLEVNGQLGKITKRYGNGAIEKIIENRKKWDMDYCGSFEELETTYEGYLEKIEDALDQTVILRCGPVQKPGMTSMGNEPDLRNKFFEGPVERCTILQLVDMEQSRIKCLLKALKFEDEFEVDCSVDII